MSPAEERWQRVGELFDEARQRPAAQWCDFLQAACPDDSVRAEVETLLRSHAALQGPVGGDFLEGLDVDRAARLLTRSHDHVSPEAEELSPGESIGRYRIVRRVGAGGMGVVYLAHDPRLDRPAAVKLLSAHLTLDPAARRRFEEEARAPSALDHPHIATVYEVGDAPGGRLYIAMAYYEGETLRQALDREPLPIRRVLELGAQIASALAAAHRHGIVHRDVKPANVVVTEEGVAKLVDFGVAKAAGRALTRTGTLPGTVAYMSPEQTAGDVVDPRTDVWAMGVMLYEMLAGRHPFVADGEQPLIHRIRHDEPTALERVRPGVPPELATLVSRCLSKSAAARYPDAGALLGALRAVDAGAAVHTRQPWRHSLVISVLVAFALAAAGTMALWSALPVRGDAPGVVAVWNAGDRLAVLPLAYESPDPEDAYFAEAMTDELIAGLSGMDGLRVMSRASIMTYQDRGSDVDLAKASRELGAAALLAGTLHRTAQSVRLSLQLVDAATQERLWTAELETDAADVPALSRAAAAHVAAALQVSRAVAPLGAVADRAPERADAYTEYLRGRYFLGKRDERSFGAARDHFLRALDHDPTFARAWSGLSDAYNRLGGLSGLPQEEAYPRARAAAERALALDPHLADAHASLATALVSYYWDADAAGRHLRRALELDPSAATAYEAYARHLRNLGRFDDALVEARTAQELDPLSSSAHIEEAIIHYVAGRHDQAIAKLQRLLAASPDVAYAHHGLALNYAQQRRYDEALAALDRVQPPHVNTRAIRGVVHAMAGQQAEARRMLAVLHELARKQPVSVFHKAAIHARLGEHDRALALLEEGIAARDPYLLLLKVEPIFETLRPLPRFQAVLDLAGLSSGVPPRAGESR
jgi:eukaryotic-like serine/threonine-protein kinase